MRPRTMSTSPAAPPIDADAVVIGAGPVGLWQVFELGLLEIRAHVIDTLPHPGGQPGELYADKPIYDIPGLPVCSGQELTDALLRQVAPFQPTLHLGHQVEALARQDDGRFLLTTQQGLQLRARAIVVIVVVIAASSAARTIIVIIVVLIPGASSRAGVLEIIIRGHHLEDILLGSRSGAAAAANFQRNRARRFLRGFPGGTRGFFLDRWRTGLLCRGDAGVGDGENFVTGCATGLFARELILDSKCLSAATIDDNGHGSNLRLSVGFR